MRKYVTSYGAQIRTVEVDRETSESVWIHGRRNAKMTGYECFHDTFDAAKDHLLKKAAHKVEIAKDELQRARTHFGQVDSLKNEGLKAR